MFRTVHPQELSKVDVEHLHMQTRASHSTFCSEHFEFVRMMAMCCWSTTSPSENVLELTGHEVVMKLIPVEFPGHEEHLGGLPNDPLQTSKCIPPRVLIQLHQSLVSLEHSTRMTSTSGYIFFITNLLYRRGLALCHNALTQVVRTASKMMLYGDYLQP